MFQTHNIPHRLKYQPQLYHLSRATTISSSTSTLLGAKCKWGRGRPRPVEVHALPLMVTAVPYSRLFALLCVGLAMFVHILGKAYISNTGCILSQQVNMRTQDHGIDCLAVFPKNIIKVKFVELQALH